MSGNSPNRAFTLIELLIVVAVIAVLAAIAVPNFLEAQTRSRVTKARADMRTYAMAMEAYRLDNNTFVPALLRKGRNLGVFSHLWLFYELSPYGIEGVGFPLTTPTAYISTILPDPFNTKSYKT